MAQLRKLGRKSAHRKSMLANQVISLFEAERIETTISKAKETQRMAEKMITLAKKGDLHSRRQAMSYLNNKEAVSMLFEEIGPKYADRNGGYTRVLKLGPRRGDAAEMAILELV